MALGPDTQEMLALRLPHLAPIAEKLNEDIATAKEKNGGWATFTLQMKKGVIEIIDVMMRQFLLKKPDE